MLVYFSFSSMKMSLGWILICLGLSSMFRSLWNYKKEKSLWISCSSPLSLIGNANSGNASQSQLSPSSNVRASVAQQVNSSGKLPYLQ